MFGLLGIKYTRNYLVYKVPKYTYQAGRGKNTYEKSNKES